MCFLPTLCLSCCGTAGVLCWTDLPLLPMESYAIRLVSLRQSSLWLQEQASDSTGHQVGSTALRARIN